MSDNLQRIADIMEHEHYLKLADRHNEHYPYGPWAEWWHFGQKYEPFRGCMHTNILYHADTMLYSCPDCHENWTALLVAQGAHRAGSR